MKQLYKTTGRVVWFMTHPFTLALLIGVLAGLSV